MKNLFKFMMAVAVLFTASCAKEEISTSIAGGEVEVSFTADLAGLSTRATYGTGSAVNTLRWFVYSADENGQNVELLSDLSSKPNDPQSIAVNVPCTVNLVLIKGMKYNILFWADKGEESPYTVNNGVVSFNTHNGENVIIDANDESRDAFYAVRKSFDPATATSDDTNVVLTRPFAQLNAIVSNMEEVGKSFNLNADNAYIKSTIATKICTSFNPFTGVAGDETTTAITFGKTNVQDFAEGHLSMNYLLAPGHLSDVTFYFEGEKFATNTTIKNVPLKANYKTNVIGNLLTGATEFNVSIDAEWAPQEEYILDGGEVELTEDIVAKKVVVKKNTVLKLNGKKIVGGQPDSAEMTGTDIAAITVENGATLTIEGEGTIEGTEYGVYAKNGNVVIKGGTFTAGTSAVQVYNGTATIEGGEFSATKSNVYVVNCIDASYNNGTAVVNITGGSFYKFDPANNTSEGVGTNFCAEGYTAKANGEWYDVVVDSDNYVLVDGTTKSFVAESGKTYLGVNNPTIDYINLNGADNVTIKNITFDAANAIPCVDGQGTYKVYANIVTGIWQEAQANKGAFNLVIDNCTFRGSFKSGKPGAAVALTDYNRTSGYSGNVTIKNCTFETLTDYGGYDIYGHYCGNSTNGYGDFVIENNTFNSTRPNGQPVYLGRYASNVPVVVKGNAFETVSSLDNAVYVQDHSNYGVSVNATGNTFAQ